MKKLTSILVIFLFAITQINAQEEEYSPYVQKGFVIVAAGKNYDAMKKMASEVSEKLDYELELRGLDYNKEIGLTFSEDECNDSEYDFPWYARRELWDEGEYVSIEYTTDYDGFTPELYIIVVSSHDKGSQELTDALEHTKKYYKNAYIKYSEFYMGCGH
jgi:hypothetical protein